MKYDELDNLFRKKLLDERPASDLWNVPPDSVFENALSRLLEKNQRKRKFIFLRLLGLAILITGLSYTYIKFKRLENELAKIQVVNSNIEHHGSTIKPTKAVKKSIEDVQLGDKKNSLLEKKNILTSPDNYSYNHEKDPYSHEENKLQLSSSGSKPNSYLSTFEVSQPISLLKANSSKNPSVHCPDVNKFQYHRNSEAAGAILNSENSSNAPVSYDESGYIYIPPLHEDKYNDDLAFLQFKKLFVTDPLEGFSDHRHIQKEIENKVPQNKNSWELYFLTGVNASRVHMKQKSVDETNLKKYDQYRPGFQFQAGALKKLNNKWFLDAELNFMQFNNTSLHKNEMTFSNANLVVIEDIPTYMMELSIDSPLRSMKTRTSFGIKDIDISEGETFNSKTNVDLRVNNIGIGLGIRRLVYQNDIFSFDLGLTARLQYLSAVRESMNSDVVFNGKVLHSEFQQINKNQDIRRFLISPVLSGRVRVELSEKLSFLGSVAGQRGLNSVWDKQIDGKRKTYFSSIQFAFGLSLDLN